MDTWLLWGTPVVVWLQSVGSFLVTPMKLLSILGTEDFFLLVMPAMVWCIDASLGLRMGMILLTSAGVNSILKVLVGWPRPFWISDSVKPYAFESSYGLPSGHAENSMALWGRMAAGLKRTGWVIGLGILIFLISLSRLYLGVHFPSDVLAGWIVAGILLALFLWLEKPVAAWIARQPLGVQLLVPFLVALLMIGAGALAANATADRIVPEEWIARSSAAFPDEDTINPQAVDVVSSAGALFGLAAGAIFLHRWGKFSTAGTFWARLARFAVGVVGILAIYFGLRMLFPSGEGLVPQTLRFVRYTAGRPVGGVPGAVGVREVEARLSIPQALSASITAAACPRPSATARPCPNYGPCGIGLAGLLARDLGLAENSGIQSIQAILPHWAGLSFANTSPLPPKKPPSCQHCHSPAGQYVEELTTRLTDEPASPAPGRRSWNGNAYICRAPCVTNYQGAACTL